jgi:transcriptional regulator with XRE-family HTH domain
MYGNDRYFATVPAGREAEIFGSTIRRLRLERGWTQEHLAHAAGLTTTYVGQLERGVKVASLTVVLQLARGLRVSPSDLLEDFTPPVLRSLRL